MNIKCNKQVKVMSLIFPLFYKTDHYKTTMIYLKDISKCRVAVRKDWRCINKGSITLNNTVSSNKNNINKQQMQSWNKMVKCLVNLDQRIKVTKEIQPTQTLLNLNNNRWWTSRIPVGDTLKLIKEIKQITTMWWWAIKTNWLKQWISKT